ncbi:hypothetical protein NP233_g2712 [Leucocoprinus birnbaumii]|uniref:Uncharacterized protein n=1 Tax=Leucocoprinus birnbaumii TaxID=56174 RepID=A0AAD5W0W0_9AGAR|nr:hypothetical protein NP233_g2712 [Leucocoprinus birnbaumii]
MFIGLIARVRRDGKFCFAGPAAKEFAKNIKSNFHPSRWSFKTCMRPADVNTYFSDWASDTTVVTRDSSDYFPLGSISSPSTTPRPSIETLCEETTDDELEPEDVSAIDDPHRHHRLSVRRFRRGMVGFWRDLGISAHARQGCPPPMLPPPSLISYETVPVVSKECYSSGIIIRTHVVVAVI